MINYLKLQKESLFLYLNNALVAILSFASIAILSHYLIPYEYGKFRYALSLVNISTSIGALGLAQSIYYFLNSSTNKNEEYQYINASRVILLFTSLLAGFVLFLITIAFPLPGFNINLFNIFLIVLISVLQITELNIFIKNKFTFYYFTNIISSYIIRIALFYYAYTENVKLDVYIQIWLFNVLLSAFINQIFIEYIYKNEKFVLLISKIKDLWKYSLPIGLGLFFGIVLGQTDRYIVISFFKDAEKLAILSNANFEIPIISALYTSFFTIAFPGMLKAFENKDVHSLISQRHNYQLNVSSILFPICIALIVFSTEILTFLFGDFYHKSATLFAIYSITYFFRFTSYHDLFLISGRTKFIAYIQAVEMFFHILLCTLFIYWFDVLGASIAVLVTNFLYFLVSSYLGAKTCKIPLHKLYPNKQLLFNLLISIVVVSPFYLIIHLQENLYLKIIFIAVYCTFATLTLFYLQFNKKKNAV